MWFESSQRRLDIIDQTLLVFPGRTVHSFMHSSTRQTLVEFILCARHWGYKMNRKAKSCSPGTYFSVEENKG